MFNKSLQASSDSLMLPARQATFNASCLLRAGGPDSGAGHGESHLEDLLQQSCAERIRQLKAEKHNFDNAKPSMGSFGGLHHSDSRGTTRAGSEPSTRVATRNHSVLSLSLDADLF